MKNKFISVILFFILAYYIPLLGNLPLLFSVQILLLFSISAVLITTQPALSIDETNQEKSHDKFSIIGILIACLLSQIVSVIEWAYFNKNHEFVLDTITLTGLILILSGTAFRVYSIKTLGKYFTGTVQTQANQKIITAGPYSLIRHPSYTGTCLWCIGSPLFLHAYIGILVSAIVILTAYYYRIKVEEDTLLREFGKEYKVYQSRTKKLLPYIY